MAPKLSSSALLALLVYMLGGASASSSSLTLLSGGAVSNAELWVRSAELPPISAPDWDPACYRTNDQVQAFLQGVASTYPQIATFSDAGTSWEGARHLWLLRLTNLSRPGPKPSIFLLAGQRPRDIAGPEILLRYISYLLQKYNVDPDITFLIDNREIYFMPVTNPDGYWQIYSNGFSWFKKTVNAISPSEALRLTTGAAYQSAVPQLLNASHWRGL